ncbi:MAG: YihA family ribosome biogenesis GTP-binding protein [Chlamydiia bacterium]|nr:YihA family ribosome biogenesis GTP-binding protein [Chlamydiia bacterium]
MKGCFDQGFFIKSASSSEGYPNLTDEKGNPLPEIAFVGRSNVGKSSLINHLFNQRSLAKTSQIPGKTQLINFYKASHFLLVDLPGYGYAKVGKKEQKKWSEMIDSYLTWRKNLRGVVFLLDCRRDLNSDDRLFLEWASAVHLPLILVFTKCDKLLSQELLLKRKTLPHELQNLNAVFASTKWGKMREELGSKLMNLMQ